MDTFVKLRCEKNKLYTDLLMEIKSQEIKIIDNKNIIADKKNIMDGGNITSLYDMALNSFSIQKKAQSKFK